ncbi:MAG: hypothetical protein NTV86_16745, partial [Planctomycetota bacterium]|nr:hypothetical protein [Planctomycetota bacterium]
AGRSSATIYVQAIDDGLAEPAEALTLNVSSSDRYRIASARASATIAVLNNPLPGLSRLGAQAPTDDIWPPLMLHYGMTAPTPAPALV